MICNIKEVFKDSVIGYISPYSDVDSSLEVIIVDCSQLNPGTQGEHLSSQLSWVAT